MVLASVLQSTVFVVFVDYGVDLKHLRLGNKVQGFADTKNGDYAEVK